MQFTGTDLIKKRSFYSQNNNFGVGCSLYVDNPTGQYKIGVSGANAVFEIVLESGKILKDDLFLHAYAPFETMNLEFQFNPGSYNLYKNNSPIVMGGAKSSGDYNYFYISRQDTSLNAQFDLFVSGNQTPRYTISEIGYWLDSGQKEVTGTFSNNGSYSFQVFDSSAQLPGTIRFDKLTGVIAPGQTGYFKYTGSATQFLNTSFDEPIFTSFSTNFNEATVDFRIIDARSFESFVFLQPVAEFVFDANNQIARSLTYSNYSGGQISNGFNTNLIFSLEYISGSGFFSNSSNSYITTGYGNFIESGLLTGIAETITGNILVETTGWATGEAGGIFSGLGTGYATGIGYSGLASGIFTGFLTGTIYDGSGKLLVGYPALGNGLGTSISLPEITQATGALFPTHFTSTLFSWDSGRSTNAAIRLTCSIGSGSPTFSFGGSNGTIYWGSGQDILYAMSGMGPIFGITGHMSGSSLYLYTTGTNTDANNRYLQAFEGYSLYPGVGDPDLMIDSKFFTGADGSTVATGYIDLSNPYYTNNPDIRIRGYNNRTLTCIFRPAKSRIQKNVFFRFNPFQYEGFYSDAESLASGFNKFPENPFSGHAVGNQIFITAKENGVEGNEISIAGTEIGFVPNNGQLIGGSVSTKATGYIELYNNDTIRDQIQERDRFSNLYFNDIGYLTIFSGSSSWTVRKYSAQFRFEFSTENNQEISYTSNQDILSAFDDSAVGEIWMDASVFNTSGIFLTAKQFGPTGNLNYFRLGNLATGRRSLTGGGTLSLDLPVIPVGVYTGNLNNIYITGSGNYEKIISETGAITEKTFTGQWDVLTGIAPSNLYSIKNSQITSTLIISSGDYLPNETMYFRIDHDPIFTPDVAIFRISGSKVINTLSRTLIQ